jgi:hypothetical protein
MNTVNQQNREPKLFDGHGHDTRYNGPLSVSPTVSAAYGEGGGNIPLVLCISPENEAKGMPCRVD